MQHPKHVQQQGSQQHKGTGAAAQGSTAQPQSSPTHGQGNLLLSPMTLKWVNAELGKKVKLTGNEETSFVKQLSDVIKKQERPTNELIKKFIQDHCGKQTKIPHRAEDRAKFVFDIVVKAQD